MEFAHQAENYLHFSLLSTIATNATMMLISYFKIPSSFSLRQMIKFKSSLKISSYIFTLSSSQEGAKNFILYPDLFCSIIGSPVSITIANVL